LFFMTIENETKREIAEQLYEQYKNLLYVCAYEILQDKQLSEDALQETFIRVMKNIHKIAKVICPKTRHFLVTICRNVSINMYNERKHMYTVEIESTKEAAHEDYINNPQEIVISMDAVMHIKDAIKKLKPIYRDVLALKQAYEYTDLEICELLQIKPETLRKRVLRGRKMLKEILAKEGLR